ncbi:odorant receptor 46a-like [Diachasmimorpha longicaudata]|uniref:odorant receptor 46a-like n=1 Tax=Diachasmimorpha longicaudata TaxID=58733 RepID=UPI0030B8AC1F
MGLLQENFIYLRVNGLWSPIEWSSNNWKLQVYRLYTTFLITATYWFGITESINLFIIVDTIEDFSDNSFMLLTTIVICVKANMILSKKWEIRALIAAFEGHPHKPMNTDEEMIQATFNARIRLISCIFGAVGEISVLIMTVSVFFQGIPYGELPYKAWMPYDYSEPLMYWSTFCLQLLVVIFLANATIGFDTLLVGMFVLICAQFNILKYRLEKAIDEVERTSILTSDERISDVMKTCERRIIECVKYHREILRISEKMNSLFAGVIFVQYAASTIVICISVFMISQVPVLSTKILFIFCYLLCMLVQISSLCIAAHQATFESQQLLIGIFHLKWYVLSNRARGYLILMMVRTLRPVVFTSGHIAVLSVESFGTLLKRSYTAYTVLQKSNS